MRTLLLVLLLATTAHAQVADLAPKYRQRNRGGSCGHCSTAMHLRWLQLESLGDAWWNTYRGGENWPDHLAKLRRHGIKFIATSDGDTRLLEYAIRSGRGAVVYHPPRHITNFVGRVTRNGQQYACILDNNTPHRIDFHPYDQWVRSWRRCSGCAFVILNGTPPPEVPR